MTLAQTSIAVLFRVITTRYVFQYWSDNVYTESNSVDGLIEFTGAWRVRNGKVQVAAGSFVDESFWRDCSSATQEEYARFILTEMLK
jgi:hypothetical protein